MTRHEYTVHARWQLALTNTVLVDDGDEEMVNMKSTVLTELADLRNRFVDRLSAFTATRISVVGGRRGQSIDISITRDTTLPYPRVTHDGRLRSFLKVLDRTMRIMTADMSVFASDKARTDLRNAMMDFSLSSVEQVINDIKRCFTKHDGSYMDMITRHSRFFISNENEDSGNRGVHLFDDELVDALGEFRNNIHDCSSSGAGIAPLVAVAANLLKNMKPLDQRLHNILCLPEFANELYTLIKVLAFPSFLYRTCVRTAMSFHMSMKAVPPPLARGDTSSRSSKASLGSWNTRVNIQERHRVWSQKKSDGQRSTPSGSVHSSPSSSYASPSSSKTSSTPSAPSAGQAETRSNPWSNHVPDGATAAAEQQLLPPKCEYVSSKILNRSEQDVASLISSVTKGNLLAKASPAWYTFGFVTACDDEQERLMGGMYKVILTESKQPQEIFAEFVKAISQNTLADFIEAQDFKPLRGYFPLLDEFLRTPTNKRPTVWELVQYSQLEFFQEPSSVLKRDYGFQFCRNHQDVKLLKNIYCQVLIKSKPMELHDACRFGRLQEHFRMKGVVLDPQHLRFMHNSYPDPTIGFDNGLGLERYLQPLFKSSLKH